MPREVPRTDTSDLVPVLSNFRASSAALLFFDFTIIIIARVVTGASYHLAAYGSFGDLPIFLITGALAGAGFCALVRITERRYPFKASQANERAKYAALFWVLSFLALTSVVFVLKAAEHISRGAMLLFFVCGGLAVIVSRVKAPIFFLKPNQARPARRSLIMVGTRGDGAVDILAASLGAELCALPVVIGLDAQCAEDEWQLERERVCAQVMEVARTTPEGVIAITSQHLPHERLQAIIRSLSLVPRTILVIPDAQTSYFLHQPLMPFGTTLGVEVQKAPLNRVQRAIKRMIDVTLSSALLVLTCPVLVLISVAIKFDGSGPILFRQARKGLGGKPFNIFKFRTLRVLEDGDTVEQVSPGDQRVTRVGQWLRQSSLDELPQLFNVLKGQMSLVGPRPHALAHDNFYSTLVENYELRQHVKPGITGWAQVNGFRGATPTVFLMRHRIEYDLWYVTHASILLDLKILALTVIEVMKQRNAY